MQTQITATPTFLFRDLRCLLEAIHKLPEDWDETTDRLDEIELVKFKRKHLLVLTINKPRLEKYRSRKELKHLSSNLKKLSTDELIDAAKKEYLELLNEVYFEAQNTKEDSLKNEEDLDQDTNEDSTLKNDRQILEKSVISDLIVKDNLLKPLPCASIELEDESVEEISVDLTEIKWLHAFLLFLVLCIAAGACQIIGEFLILFKRKVSSEVIADEPSEWFIERSYYGMYNSRELLNPHFTKFSMAEKLELLEKTEFFGPTFYKTIPTDPSLYMFVYKVDCK